MYEEARSELADALEDRDQPIPVDEAREIAGDNSIVAESVINKYAQTNEQGGEVFVTGLEDGPQMTVNDIDSSDTSDAADDDVSSVEPEDDADPSPDVEAVQDVAGSVQWDVSDDHDVYEINGIRTPTNPAEMLVGEPTGDDYYSVPVLTNGNDRIPNEPSTYMPVPIAGGRDSEEIIGRVMGELNRPLLLEGDAGTGKNLAVDVFGYETKRTKFRINFGSDVSVFDLVGEKDIVDGDSVYILGKLSKPALFGGLVIFDEVNMVSGDVSSFIHGVTEEPGSRSLELRGTGVTLTDIPVSQDEIDRYGSWYEAARAKWNPEDHLGKYIHPEFRVTATCNPLDYADTKSMNSAFRDRFVVVEHPYLTEAAEGSSPSSTSLNTPNDPQMGVKREAALLQEETGIDEDAALALVDVVALLREAKSQNNAIACPVTHRALLKTVELAGRDQSFMPFKDALRLVLVGHASTKQDKRYIRDTIADEL